MREKNIVGEKNGLGSQVVKLHRVPHVPSSLTWFTSSRLVRVLFPQNFQPSPPSLPWLHPLVARGFVLNAARYASPGVDLPSTCLSTSDIPTLGDLVTTLTMFTTPMSGPLYPNTLSVLRSLLWMLVSLATVGRLS